MTVIDSLHPRRRVVIASAGVGLTAGVTESTPAWANETPGTPRSSHPLSTTDVGGVTVVSESGAIQIQPSTLGAALQTGEQALPMAATIATVFDRDLYQPRDLASVTIGTSSVLVPTTVRRGSDQSDVVSFNLPQGIPAHTDFTFSAGSLLLSNITEGIASSYVASTTVTVGSAAPVELSHPESADHWGVRVGLGVKASRLPSGSSIQEPVLVSIAALGNVDVPAGSGARLLVDGRLFSVVESIAAVDAEGEPVLATHEAVRLGESICLTWTFQDSIRSGTRVDISLKAQPAGAAVKVVDPEATMIDFIGPPPSSGVLQQMTGRESVRCEVITSSLTA